MAPRVTFKLILITLLCLSPALLAQAQAPDNEIGFKITDKRKIK